MAITAIIGVGTAGCKIVSMLDDTAEYDAFLVNEHNIQTECFKNYKEFIIVAPFGGLTGTILTLDLIKKLHKNIFAKKVLITSLPLTFECESKQILAQENIQKAKKYCQVFVVSDMNLTNKRNAKIKDLFSTMDTRFINQIETKLKTFAIQEQIAM